MALDQIVGKLTRQPIFRGLTPAQLREIARRAERVVYNPGSVIIEENRESEGAILLVSGEATRVSGPELKTRLEPIPDGALLCEPGMLVDTHHGSTVVARTQVRALLITREGLHEQMLTDPTIADQLTANLGHRLSQLAVELRRVDDILGGRGQAALPPPKAASKQALPAPAS